MEKIHVLGRRSAVGKSLGGFSGTGAVRKDASTKTRNSKDETDYVKKNEISNKETGTIWREELPKRFAGGGFYEASITWDPEFQSLFKINPCFLLRIKFIIGVSLIILQQQTMIQWADISDS